MTPQPKKERHALVPTMYLPCVRERCEMRARVTVGDRRARAPQRRLLAGCEAGRLHAGGSPQSRTPPESCKSSEGATSGHMSFRWTWPRVVYVRVTWIERAAPCGVCLLCGCRPVRLRSWFSPLLCGLYPLPPVWSGATSLVPLVNRRSKHAARPLPPPPSRRLSHARPWRPRSTAQKRSRWPTRRVRRWWTSRFALASARSSHAARPARGATPETSRPPHTPVAAVSPANALSTGGCRARWTAEDRSAPDRAAACSRPL